MGNFKRFRAAGLGAAVAAFAATDAGAVPVTVTVTNSASTLAAALVGTGVTISGASFTGASGAAGTFTGGTAAGLGFNSGIVLSTGSAAALGTAFDPTPVPVSVGTQPVNSYTPPSVVNGTPGTALIPNSFNAATLSFSFTSDTTAASFSYIFASGEYPNFVGSGFNDQFRFLLNGTDIALLPGTSTLVSINSVNNGNFSGTVAPTNPGFFVDNRSGTNPDFPYGGRTVTLTAGVTGLVPNATNTLTLVIADVADQLLDSVVLVQAGSLTNEPPNPVPLPAGLSLLGVGLLGMAVARGRRGR